ncbi:hypothetical protein EVAR_9900_1 [Eumeta japonica]|uniref:Uncharacterized protein n=1 Tax=Eumeta variegata TaxID=151549 RepID=A0A4C1TQJ4_EUMVA|nr:hypothetical protein EVAR_9900_1 [Eumeta japonica]
MDTGNPGGVTSAYPVKNVMSDVPGLGRRNSHSLDETQQRKLLLHICLYAERVWYLIGRVDPLPRAPAENSLARRAVSRRDGAAGRRIARRDLSCGSRFDCRAAERFNPVSNERCVVVKRRPFHIILSI